MSPSRVWLLVLSVLLGLVVLIEAIEVVPSTQIGDELNNTDVWENGPYQESEHHTDDDLHDPEIEEEVEKLIQKMIEEDEEEEEGEEEVNPSSTELLTQEELLQMDQEAGRVTRTQNTVTYQANLVPIRRTLLPTWQGNINGNLTSLQTVDFTPGTNTSYPSSGYLELNGMDKPDTYFGVVRKGVWLFRFRFPKSLQLPSPQQYSVVTLTVNWRDWAIGRNQQKWDWYVRRGRPNIDGTKRSYPWVKINVQPEANNPPAHGIWTQQNSSVVFKGQVSAPAPTGKRSTLALKVRPERKFGGNNTVVFLASGLSSIITPERYVIFRLSQNYYGIRGQGPYQFVNLTSPAQIDYMSLQLSLTANDRDGDGVQDSQDGCPDDPLHVQPAPCGCACTTIPWNTPTVTPQAPFCRAVIPGGVIIWNSTDGQSHTARETTRGFNQFVTIRPSKVNPPRRMSFNNVFTNSTSTVYTMQLGPETANTYYFADSLHPTLKGMVVVGWNAQCPPCLQKRRGGCRPLSL
jgi:hypothetical protein